MDTKEFLDDQYDQLDKIIDGFKIDLGTLNDIVTSWEELPDRNITELSEIIKSKIKNKTTIEIYQDEQSRYLLDLKFAPINILWQIQVENSKAR